MRFCFWVIFFLFIVTPSWAALPLINDVDASGSSVVPVRPVWDTSSAVEYHPESGSCGPFSNSEMIDKFEESLSVWTDIDGIDLSFSAVEDEIGSIDDTNIADYFYNFAETDDDAETLATDGINPVAFDDTGDIVESIFGEQAEAILGFASIIAYEDDEITDAEVVINCKCIADHPTESCSFEVTEADLSFTLAHEMGHFINLGHSQANYNLMIDWAADDYDEASKPFDDGDLPIMFPTSSDMSEVIPQGDDELAAKMLYSESSITDEYCKATGYIVDSSGDNYVPCLDIWAVTEDEDAAETLTTMSGGTCLTYNSYYENSFAYGDDCDENCGYFELYVKPATAYTILAYDVYSSFTDASSVGPCVSTLPDYDMYGEEIATISADDCPTATDEAIDLGTISIDATTESETVSSGDDSDDSSGSDGSSGSKGGGQDSGPDYNPMDYWSCSLHNKQPNQQQNHSFIVYYLLLALFGFLRLTTHHQKQ